MSEPVASLSGDRSHRILSPDSKRATSAMASLQVGAVLAERRNVILADVGRRFRRDAKASRRNRQGEPHAERQRSERLSLEAESADPSSPSVGSVGRRQGRDGSQGQRIALISACFSSESAGDPSDPETRSVPKPTG